ncbi:MerR family transcriptional regulator [Bifidobacterium olomucense]|uniref:Multidrug transporter n=1 Tax=Bifidobacterium olomucense TaxID=2675324 RepID=A0A7Y0HXZ0_9BIFI|nr:MerR family transcriptional regulator [Bifidobacterium sp. DSM 109959]NMM99183.1 multidrug transporter [Bifidobacterium sp. DSM 109959]
MREDDDLLTIGEVAKLDGTSTKALRYYDAHGILTPFATDSRTGYRYYTPDQMLEMDVIRLCLDAGVPLDSIESFRQIDGTLDWRTLMETGRERVVREAARLRTLEISLDDYLGEVTRKARTPDDGVVCSDLPSTWMLGKSWPYYGDAFQLKPYLRSMTTLRAAVREAGLPRLLRRGILVDLLEDKAYAYQQFEPAAMSNASDGNESRGHNYGFDAALTVFHPHGGPAEGQVIERESLTACFDEALAMAAQFDPEQWRHVTICEIWGSHTAEGSMRVRMTRHHCDAGRM